jgi:TPR repeat protein
MYFQGIGTPKSIEQGWIWMNRAADKGNIQAMLELGVRYQVSTSLENG